MVCSLSESDDVNSLESGTQVRGCWRQWILRDLSSPAFTAMNAGSMPSLGNRWINVVHIDGFSKLDSDSIVLHIFTELTPVVVVYEFPIGSPALTAESRAATLSHSAID